jgi:hypothetical protein
MGTKRAFPESTTVGSDSGERLGWLIVSRMYSLTTKFQKVSKFCILVISLLALILNTYTQALIWKTCRIVELRDDTFLHHIAWENKSRGQN